MISQIFSLLVLFALGVLAVFVFAVWLQLNMTKDRKRREEEAKKKTDE